ncbi:MAG: hypothetical protein WD696_19430 [Bryobacteraceae bacterium]
MATVSLPAPAIPARASARWIITPRADLVWVIGSSLAGYLYLFLNLVLQVPFTWLWWFWSVGFDGTHIFGTASRTFFDRQARSERRLLLFGSLLFFFSLGPLMVWFGWKLWLAILVGIWAYYHVMRQHYGFLMLYKIKNRDLAPLDNRLDRGFLTAMLIAPPFLRFFVRSPEELGLPREMALGALVPGLEPALLACAGAFAAFYIGRQAAQARAGRPLNVPKLLLLAGVVPLHWATFAWMSWKAAVPTVTIVHNLQYHALIWFHNRNRYGGERAAARNGRLPVTLAASLAGYVGFALLFSLLYRVPGFHLGRMSDMAFGFFCGFGLTHYYLDARIWRVREDHDLRQALGLGTSP